MKNHIAAAFQNTVDFELKWDTAILESLIRQHRISQSEIQSNRSIQSERDLIITLLAHMTEGSGSECLAASSQITRSFASHFPYDITLGGTAVRAAMAIEKIGYRSTIHACSLNRHFCRLIPEAVSWVSGVPDEGADFHPHVIVQYPADIRIHINDIDFTTRNPNRVIFTYDPPSMRLEISDAFAEELSCANVFLIASYNIIKDKNILKNRLQKTLSFINALPPLHTVIMEDGRFEDPHMRKLVTETLAEDHGDLFVQFRAKGGDVRRLHGQKQVPELRVAFSLEQLLDFFQQLRPLLLQIKHAGTSSPRRWRKTQKSPIVPGRYDWRISLSDRRALRAPPLPFEL